MNTILEIIDKKGGLEKLKVLKKELTAFLKTWERNLKDQGSLEAVKCH